MEGLFIQTEKNNPKSGLSKLKTLETLFKSDTHVFYKRIDKQNAIFQP